MANRIIITDTAEACVSNDGEYCLIDQCQFFRTVYLQGNKVIFCVLFPEYSIDNMKLMEINGTPARSERCKHNELKEGK